MQVKVDLKLTVEPCEIERKQRENADEQQRWHIQNHPIQHCPTPRALFTPSTTSPKRKYGHGSHYTHTKQGGSTQKEILTDNLHMHMNESAENNQIFCLRPCSKILS